jgi:hypothetical protein
MSFLVPLKAIRLLLAVSVSIWLAGGCLLGCGNAMALESGVDQSTKAAVEGESCHAAQAHHCCSKAQTTKQSKHAKQTPMDPKLNESLLALTSVPRGMMGDCPLAIGATAITSKSNSTSPDSTQATSAELPLSAGNGELPQRRLVAPLLPNRGPTYLRCCVFLI